MRMILMREIRASQYSICFLGCYLMPIIVSQPFLAYGACMVTLKPDLQTGDAEQMTALGERTYFEDALANHTKFFRVFLAIPSL